MRKVQSILAGLLSVCLLTCWANAMSFPDVDDNGGYAAAVDNLSEWGIMVGDSQGKFNPEQTVSRAEMATIICRMLGVTENLPKTAVFTDVPESHWANAYIGKASQLGIVNGYGDGKFGPSDPVTYEQAITMVIRAIGEGENATRYGGYPKGYLQAAEERSLLNEMPPREGTGMSRGAIAILLNNYYMWNINKPGEEHAHHYEAKTVPGSGSGGHYEQVQTGTKTVEKYEQVTIWGCGVCDFTTTDVDEIHKHAPVELIPGTHAGANIWSQTKTEPVTREEPVYESKWVEDSEKTISICVLCGRLEP